MVSQRSWILSSFELGAIRVAHEKIKNVFKNSSQMGKFSRFCSSTLRVYVRLDELVFLRITTSAPELGMPMTLLTCSSLIETTLLVPIFSLWYAKPYWDMSHPHSSYLSSWQAKVSNPPKPISLMACYFSGARHVIAVMNFFSEQRDLESLSYSKNERLVSDRKKQYMEICNKGEIEYSIHCSMKTVLPTCAHVAGTCSFLFLHFVAMCIIK